jgi:aminopeptidase N
MRLLLLTLLVAVCALSAFAQVPNIQPGVSKDLAAWRAARYSDVRYKLNFTLEKMSPVLKGTLEIRVNISPGTQASPPATSPGGVIPPIVLDWRKIAGHEKDSTISNVTINGKAAAFCDWGSRPNFEWSSIENLPLQARNQPQAFQVNEHLLFREGIIPGENVITLDFTSPILSSGSAVLRAAEKDGSEYIYSIFVPMNVSRAFPVFDQANLKATISLTLEAPNDWNIVSNTNVVETVGTVKNDDFNAKTGWSGKPVTVSHFAETNPISIYEFRFRAGPKK